MKRHICPHCGFQSLTDPGECCPGCGYLFSYLNHHLKWHTEALGKAQEEIPIRRLKCALVGQDDQKDGALVECTITNRSLRLLPCGYYRIGRTLSWERLGSFPLEIVLPYRWMTKITPGTHMGEPARFFTYHLNAVGPIKINLWFFVDLGIASRQPDIDEQVRQTVEEFIEAN